MLLEGLIGFIGLLERIIYLYFLSDLMLYRLEVVFYLILMHINFIDKTLIIDRGSSIGHNLHTVNIN
mgnify:CR=1 FL=1